MFSVYLCNSAYVKDRILIYADERSDEDELKLISPKLTMEVNQAGSFEFGIPVGNAGYDDIEPMVSEILVMREDPATVSAKRWRGGVLWFGRVISMTTDVWKTKQCYCEGGLSYLNDVIATSFSTSRDMSSVSIGEALMTRTKNSVEKIHYNVYPDHDFSGQMRKYCLTNYGSNIKDHYLKYLGYATYYDATKNYIWSVEPVIYQNGDDAEHYYQRKQGLYVWNDLSILELITNVVGDDGYYWIEKGDVTVDDFADSIMVNQLHLAHSYTEFNEDRHQTFHIGENIIDYVKEDDMTDIYTAVHPYGTAEGEDHTTTVHFNSDEEYTTTNKQIKLKYSKDYPGVIYRPDLVKRYGMVVKNLDVGTYVAQEQLIMYTLSYFDSQNYIETSIERDGKTRIVTFRTLEIKAADMGMMGADYSMIQLMDPVHVVSEIHDVDLYANVTKIEIDLQSPENSIYTINSSTTGSSIYNGTGSSVTGGSTPAGTSYRHPRHTAHDLGLWKIENDNLGHVTNAQAVNKKDITDLGIPGEDTNTTYELSKDGNTIKMTGSDGSTSEVEVEVVSDTTYTLTKNGNEITLTGSDGTTYAVVDSDTVYTHPKFTEYANGLYKITVNDEGHVSEAAGVTKDDITALGIPGEDTNTTYELSKDGNTIKMTGSDGTSYSATVSDTFYTYVVRSERSSNDLVISTTEVKNGAFVHKLNAASFRWDGSQSLQNGAITFGGYLFGTLYDGVSYPSIHQGKFGTELSVKITPKGDSWVYGCTSLAAEFSIADGFTLLSKIKSAPAKWDTLTNPTYVKIGYDSNTGTATLITDFANDILVHNVVNHDNNTVTGKRNLVEGTGNTVSGNNNLVGGSSNTVTAIESIVNGGSNTVGGERNIVIGASNTASGINGATFGHGNINKPDHGFVANFDNTLTEHAASSTVVGYVNYCDATCQFICGRYNKKDPGVYDDGWKTYYGKYALIVGNGGSDTERSNAFAVDWDGNLWCGNDTTSLNAQIAANTKNSHTHANKAYLDKITDPTRYLRYNAAGSMVKDTWYKFASFTSTQHYNYSTAIFAAGFRYNVMRLFRITAGTANGKPAAERIYLSNITGDVRGIVGYIINGNTVNFFLKPSVNIYGYVGRIGATAETGDFIQQTDLTAATSSESSAIIPLTAALTDVQLSVSSEKLSTARKINTVAFDGTADITVPRSKLSVHSATGTNGSTGYVKIATVTVVATYSNQPTTFWYMNRGCVPVKLILRFANANSKDPSITVARSLVSLSENNYMTAWYVKSATSTWDIYVTKYEAYDEIRILDCQVASGITVEYKNEHAAALPSGAGQFLPNLIATTASTVANATTWNGLSDDTATYNSADTWLLVKNGNKIQHRLSYELVVKQAATLTETAWTAVPTTDATSMNINSLKYKKVGQMVYVLGDISFTASQSTGKLGTLPSGCRPSSNVYTAGWDGNKVAAFGIVVNTSGVISVQSPSSTAGWFDKNLTFHISCNFVI